MNRTELLIEMIKEIAGGDASSQLMQGVVVSVEDDNTCTVTPTHADDMEITGVQLQSVEGGAVGLLMKPKEGSNVVYQRMGDSQYFIVKTDALESVSLKIEGTSILVNKDEIVMNDGSNGGLIKLNTLVAELNKNNMILSTLIGLLASPIPEPGNGSPSAFQAVLNGALSSLQVGDFTSLENDKVKH